MAAGSERLRVGVIMGSDSDMSTMKETGRALRDAGMEPTVHYNFEVVSAHRMPDEMSEYAKTAVDEGIDVIVAGAGGSAHLPGMVASETDAVVLGVAVTSNPDTMNRALGSLIGMPEGKPLATFQAAEGAYAAGALAARILGIHHDSSRVGIVAAAEQDSEMMSHVGRALGALGLHEYDDFDYITPEQAQQAYKPGNWARENGYAVLVGSTNNEGGQRTQDLARMTGIPVFGVANTPNPDKMSVALDSLVNGHPIAAFQAKAGAFNAGLKAARVLALRNPDLRQNLATYNADLKAPNVAKRAIMKRIGDVRYMALGKEELQQLIDAEQSQA